ncbi:hypothetical protein D3C85_1116240 [compost metagenome]
MQGADGVAWRHHAAGVGQQRADPAIAAQHAAGIDRHRRLQRTIDRQPSLVDQGRAGVSAVTGEHQGSDALLGQAAMASDIVAPQVQPAAQVVAAPLGRLAGIHQGADTRQIDHELARAVATGDAERLGNVLFGDQHARAPQPLVQVDHAPAVQGVDARCAHVGGGGAQHAGDLCAAHVGEALHQHRRRTGGMGRGHGRTVLVGIALGQVFQAGAANHRAVDPGAGGRYAEARGIAATGRERADQVRVGAAGVGVLL